MASEQVAVPEGVIKALNEIVTLATREGANLMPHPISCDIRGCAAPAAWKVQANDDQRVDLCRLHLTLLYSNQAKATELGGQKLMDETGDADGGN